MSRGPGRIQREIMAALEADPHRRLTTAEIAAIVYGDPVEDWHLETVSRSLRTLAPRLGLSKCRVAASGRFGWHHLWGRAV
ncbi:hypothetical protein [Neorhizobium petrolearium]|uniref:hypothetical protein n=1 Tax=Neorhizobium petrolearium TaxID=515361 RepID=UPI003F7D7BF0